MARPQGRRAQGKQKAKAKVRQYGPKQTPPKGRPTGTTGGSGSPQRRPVRPGWLAVWAALVALIGSGLLIASASDAYDARGMREAPTCGGAVTERTGADDCLQEVRGRVDGPHGGGRYEAVTWRFRPTEASQADVEYVGVPGLGRRTLRAWGGSEVVGLYWHGDLVAFEGPHTDERVETDDFGMTTSAMFLFAALALLSLSLVLVREFLVRARPAGRRSGDWLKALASAVGVPALLGFALVVMFGTSVSWAFGLAGLALVVLVGWLWFRRRRERVQTDRSSASMIR